MLVSKWNISILPAHLLPQGASFGALKIAVSPVTAVHKSALLTITTTALNEINQSEQSPQIRFTQMRGLEKWIIERIIWESVSK